MTTNTNKPTRAEIVAFHRQPLSKTSKIETHGSLHIETYESVGGPTDGALYVRVFYGNRSRCDAHHKFTFEKDRAEFITLIKAQEDKRLAYKAELKAKKDAFRHTLKVGDILYASWGYDQTNIDFYQVVAVREKSVTLREINQNKTETGWLQGTCTPRKDDFVSEPVLKRVTEGNTVSFSSYKSAWPWDGTPKHWTAYA
jgi:hypothetical protein